jgi:thiamine biosynthesis lipoprotein
MLADALSTALFVLGVEKSLELYNKGTFDFEAILISENEVVLTEGLEGKFTLKAKEYKIANK